MTSKPIAIIRLLSLLVAVSLGVGCSGKLIAQDSRKSHPDQAPVFVEENPPMKESKVDKLVVPKTKLDNIPFGKLNADLNKITNQFGKIDYKNWSHSFDSQGARKAGYDDELIKLAEEMMDFQNQMANDAKAGKQIFGNPDYTPSTEKHPRLIRLHQRASEQLKDKTKALPPEKKLAE